MLRITTHEMPQSVSLELEGKLAGPWVQEMANCYEDCAIREEPKEIEINLSSLTSIDAAGKQLLRNLHARGAKLIGSGCWMKGMIADIVRERAEPQTRGRHGLRTED
jgi:anti-anti-sigma regulatory factor